MATAGGPESRLADLHARGNPGHPFSPDVRGLFPRISSNAFGTHPPSSPFAPAGFTLGLTRLSPSPLLAPTPPTSQPLHRRQYFTEARCKNRIKASNSLDDLYPTVPPDFISNGYPPRSLPPLSVSTLLRYADRLSWPLARVSRNSTGFVRIYKVPFVDRVLKNWD